MKYLNCSFLISILIVMSSCNSRFKKEYYPNNTIKRITEYSKNESLKSIEEYDSLGRLIIKRFYNNNLVDSLIGFEKGQYKSYKKEIVSNKVLYTGFYENEKTEKEGFLIKDSLKTGWWNYYDKEGNVKSKREYFVLCNNYQLNQSIIFNKEKDTVYKKDDFNETVFFDYTLRDINNDKIELSYNISPISYRSKLELILINNNNFCEEEKIDTIIQLKSRKNKLILNKKNSYKGFVFDYYIDTTFVDGKIKMNSISRKIFFENKNNLYNDKFESRPNLL